MQKITANAKKQAKSNELFVPLSKKEQQQLSGGFRPSPPSVGG
ncbi:MAG TPA: hypothetical protein V6C71_10295 [Coleofasciculaceae cyanobacterium]|jgi:hypothetical protein